MWAEVVAGRTDIKITYEHYCALPEGPPRYQLIDGDLVLSPSPNRYHQTVALRLASALSHFVDLKRLGFVGIAPMDVVLTEVDVLQPNVLFVSTSRQSRLRDEGVFGAPDLCVEILSPSNRKLDLGVKRQLYARHGVIEYWIVDPDDTSVSVFHLQDDAEKLSQLNAAAILTSTLLPGFELKLDRLFAK